MIIRKQQGMENILVTQTDHSYLAGQIASHWGNGQFETPHPYQSVIRAAAFHDYGWLLYETAPCVDPETGAPYAFLQVPLRKPQLDAYQWALDWMTGLDPYAGLLMNMHRTGLWRSRYQAIAYPVSYNIKSLGTEAEAFIAGNERRQEQQKRGLEANELWTNYRLMQVWDLLGLYFCCQEPKEDYIEPVPKSYADPKDGGTRLGLAPAGANCVKFDPYPFDTRPIHIQLRCKRMPSTSYASDAAFRKAYFQADNFMMEFEIV